jgi:chloride channel, nucleotide-sensitive, 1A
MEVLHEPPDSAAFVALAEHQSATPASFYSGPPVLHYHSDRSKVRILQRELDNAPAFLPLFRNSVSVALSESSGDNHVNGDSDVERTVDGVDVWATSQ